MKRFIGYHEALGLTLAHVGTTGSEPVELSDLTGRILAADLTARVDSPSIHASLKDGYAVRSQDLAPAGTDHPIFLTLAGRITAGSPSLQTVGAGSALRITTGAPVPEGADAVLSEEYATIEGDRIRCVNTAENGRNILPKGSDIREGEIVAEKSEKVTPALTGLMATAGLEIAEVFRLPRVAVIATGDEVVAPGRPLPEGKLYASNLVEICSWLRHYHIGHKVDIAPDRKADIIAAIRQAGSDVDALITSGGIWGSERDLMLDVLEELGWQGIYHRVRIGPGKSIAFGRLDDKPFFCLPGGPPSNEMAFLQIALPALLKMKGEADVLFPTTTAVLTETVTGTREWTQFIHARVRQEEGGLLVSPLKRQSRLKSMARKNALVVIPEGTETLKEKDRIEIQLLDAPQSR